MNSILRGLLVLLCVTFIILGVVVYYYLTPHIFVEASEYNVEINTEYKGISYTARKGNKDITNEVTIEGEVDTEHLGTYPVKYKVKNTEVIVNVNVVDNTPPVIELEGESELTVCSIDKFDEPGYKVSDNYDSDLHDKVKIIEHKYEKNENEKIIKSSYIEYKVADSSGNVSAIARHITEEDDKAPTISLNGSATMNITLNSTYEEKGATAKDECEGDVSSSISTSGNVDTSKEGTYEITYKASDSKGNEAKATRKVVVKKEETTNTTNKIPQRERPVTENGTPGVIYLTFDDGPGAYTDKILDVLAKYNVKATFFVTRSGSDSTILREHQEGHTVALHTYTHDWNIYKSMDAYLDDLAKISERVKNITGVESKFVRFPGGSTNTKVYYRSNNTLTMKEIATKIESMGYKFFDWSTSVEDAGGCVNKSDKEGCVVNNFKNGLRSGKSNIVLLHDIKSYTANGLERMIQYALNNGYTFQPITDETPAYHFI